MERDLARDRQMTPSALSDFMESQRTLILASVRGDGAPVATAMWFCRVGEVLYCNTAAESAKVRQIRADDRICAVVESGDDYFSLRGVRVEGRCRVVVDPDEIARAEDARQAKARRIGSGLEDLPAWFSENRDRRRVEGRRVWLRIEPERVHSWDFSQLRDHYRAKQ